MDLLITKVITELDPKIILMFLLMLIVGTLIKISTPKIKGFIGESAVSLRISSLPNNKYIVLNNVMLKSDHIKTTQIDHVIVSVYGIFVIETKNYKGWILGSDFANMWTKNMYGKKYNFRNPLMQNYAHVRALKSILKIKEDEKFISIVAFANACDIKVKTKKHVIYINQIRKVIDTYKTTIFSEEEMKNIASKILKNNIDSFKNRREHVSNIKSRVNENNRKVASGLCPKCGGTLVKRNGKYGSFLACSNFPKCRYIKQ